MKPTRGERIFYAINYVVLTIFAITTLLPFVHIIALSSSGDVAVISGKVNFWPVDFTLDTYRFVMANKQFIQSFKVSVYVTTIGTFSALIVTFLTAYPLSKPKLPFRKPLLLFFIITMLFSGGIVPNFFLMRALNLYDTKVALFIPAILSIYNMLLIKNYLETLPEELEEAAKIDGASAFQILVKIIFPLAVPVIATVGLFYAVGFWNSYFFGIMYIASPENKPLQTYLYELVKLSQKPVQDLDIDQALKISTRSIQAATIFAATFPILAVYPFVQRYFVKGLVIGSVKG